jgi:beta-glucosidase
LSQDTEPPQRDLYETYLPPFETAVRQGRVSGVMGAYPSLYGVPQCASTNLISGILRTSWGFDGYVVCDCDAIGNIWSAFNYVATPEAAAAMGVNAGNDVDCGGTFNYLPQALQEGLTSVDNINQAVSHALKMRFRLGLFDPTNFVPWSSYGVAQNVNTPAQHSLALTVAEESMVLLKNNGILPLDRTKIHNLAVIGANATDTNMLVGNYNGTPFNPVTILAGIQQLAGPNIQVTYTLGCPLALANSGTNAPTPQMTQAALAAATNADAVIYVGGLNAQLESEDNWNVPFIGFNQGDRSQIELPSPQDSLLQQLYATRKPVIFINCSGDAIAMPWEATNLPAILQAWYPGEQGGTAVAEVLFGVVNPAGRLPVTFYAATTDLPTFTNYSMASRTYRYFNGMPLWAFGHGLSYSSFNYQSAQLDKSRASSGDQLNLTFTLQNTGTRDGDEVPQCYFRHLNSSVPQPIMALCGFKRVHLAAGQTTQVTMQIPAQQFRYWNTNQNQYVVEPGNYQLLVGAASDDIRLTLPLQVTLPPLSLSTASNVVALTWNATSNSVYQLQYTTKLAAAFWQNLGSPMVATNGMICTTDSPSTTGQKFYRVQLVQ